MSGGGNPLAAQDHLISLAQLGEFSEAHNAINHLKQVGVLTVDQIERFEAIIELLRIYPPKLILNQIDIALEGQKWLNNDEVLELFRFRLLSHEGFAFFRLDDGEGSNLPWAPAVRQSCSVLLDFNRDTFLGNWFGQEGVEPALLDGWRSVQSELSLASQQVDLVGLNSTERFRHELAVNSSRGIPSILNTYLWTVLAEHQNMASQFLCRA